MTLAIETSMIFGWRASTRPRRNTRLTASCFDPLAKGITIVTLIRDHLFLGRQDNLSRGDGVVSVPTRKGELHGTAVSVHQSCLGLARASRTKLVARRETLLELD